MPYTYTYTRAAITTTSGRADGRAGGSAPPPVAADCYVAALGATAKHGEDLHDPQPGRAVPCGACTLRSLFSFSVPFIPPAFIYIVR